MSELTWDERWKRISDRYNKEHRIDCPHCGQAQDIEFCDHPELISYYGEDDPVMLMCQYPSCEKTFFVKEHIDRTWKEGKTTEEALG